MDFFPLHCGVTSSNLQKQNHVIVFNVDLYIPTLYNGRDMLSILQQGLGLIFWISSTKKRALGNQSIRSIPIYECDVPKVKGIKLQSPEFAQKMHSVLRLHN
jgi:hypothetical protein